MERIKNRKDFKIKKSTIYLVFFLIFNLVVKTEVYSSSPLVLAELTKGEPLHIEIPSYSINIKIPDSFSRQSRLQKKIIRRVTESGLRPLNRFSVKENPLCRGSTGPFQKGYKVCFLRLGSGLKLKGDALNLNIEGMRTRLSLSVIRRGFEDPQFNGEIDDFIASNEEKFSYKKILIKDQTLIEAAPITKNKSEDTIKLTDDDRYGNTYYYYYTIDSDTLLEMGIEGVTEEKDRLTLLENLLKDLTIERLPLWDELTSDSNESTTGGYKIQLNMNQKNPTGWGNENLFGEKIRLLTQNKDFEGDYTVENLDILPSLKEDGKTQTWVYTYAQRDSVSHELKGKRLSFFFSGEPSLPNLTYLTLYETYPNGSPNPDATYKQPYIIEYTTKEGDLTVRRKIQVRNNSLSSHMDDL
jgi:hypothetical protein